MVHHLAVRVTALAESLSKNALAVVDEAAVIGIHCNANWLMRNESFESHVVYEVFLLSTSIKPFGSLILGFAPAYMALVPVVIRA